ncbi:hypothetical protein ScPMuIL_011020 [Solemya velum]
MTCRPWAWTLLLCCVVLFSLSRRSHVEATKCSRRGLAVPAGTTVNPSKVHYVTGSHVTVRCHRGELSPAASRVRHCQHSGRWSGSPGRCI